MSKSSFIGYGFIKSIPEGWFLDSFEIDQKVIVYNDNLPGPLKTFRIATLHNPEMNWYIPQECVEREDYWFNSGFADGYRKKGKNVFESMNARQVSEYLWGYQMGDLEHSIEQEEDDSHKY